MTPPKARTEDERKAPSREETQASIAAAELGDAFAGPSASLAVTQLMDVGGVFSVDRVAAAFAMSKSQLAETVGLSREALYKSARLDAPKTQARLREMLEIVSRVSRWAGGKEQAMAWYRSQPIAAFGGRTAEALVKDSQAGALRDYLDHIAVGGFA